MAEESSDVSNTKGEAVNRPSRRGERLSFSDPKDIRPIGSFFAVANAEAQSHGDAEQERTLGMVEFGCDQAKRANELDGRESAANVGHRRFKRATSDLGSDGNKHEGKPIPRRPKQQAMAAPVKTLPFPMLFLQHCLLVAPCGVVLLWLSYPKRIIADVIHAKGLLAKLSIVAYEVSTLGASLILPSIFLIFGGYEAVLNYATTHRLSSLPPLLELVDWPQGANTKMAAMSRCRYATKLISQIFQMRQRGLGLSRHASRGTIDEAKAASIVRQKNIEMWNKLMISSGDGDWLTIMQQGKEKGVDLNYPTGEGETLLYKSAQYAYVQCVTWLLSAGADPNRTVTTMSTDYGATVLHMLVGLLNQKSSSSHLEIMVKILEHPTTLIDSFDGKGNTPYMAALDIHQRHDSLLAALRPTKITWDDIEDALKRSEQNPDQLALSLSPLLRAVAESRPMLLPPDSPPGGATVPLIRPEDLRLHDLLFCRHEGSIEVLERRRRLLWDLFLKPMTEDVCTQRAMTKEEKSVYQYAWDASQGPKLSERRGRHNIAIAQTIASARETYKDDMVETLKITSSKFEGQLNPAYEALQKDKFGARLCELPAKELHIAPQHMHHGRFMQLPLFALRRDLRATLHALYKVGIIRSEGEFSDLMQQGRHRLFDDTSQKALFMSESTPEFWMGLVAMWIIGIHEMSEANFLNRMSKLAEGNEFHPAPGLKKFQRIIAKSFEYIQEYFLEKFEDRIMAPLYVIDVLRCTYQVETPKRLLQIRQALVDALPCARIKNGYSLNANAQAGYRDMKLNMVFPANVGGTKSFQSNLLVEVQLLMTENVRAKKKMHVAYTVMRGDYTNGDEDIMARLPQMNRKTIVMGLTPDMRSLQHLAEREMKSGTWTMALFVSYLDLMTTCLVAFQFGAEGLEDEKIITLAMLSFNLVVQAMTAFFTGQGLLSTMVALLGGKPLMDTYNVMAEQPLLVEGFNPERALALTRGQEVIFDSMPQLIWQSRVIVTLQRHERTWLMWGSVWWSTLSIAYLVGTFELDVDLSKRYRRLHSALTGYIPTSSMRQTGIAISIIMFVSGYLISKVMALSVLGTGSMLIAAAWLALECGTLLGLRYLAEGEWRFFMLDGAEGSISLNLLVHFGFYLGSLAAPFPVLRLPGFLGPRLYLPVVVYNLIINWVMLKLGLSLDDYDNNQSVAVDHDNNKSVVMDPKLLVFMLGSSTLGCLVGATLMGCLMNPERRSTFYKGPSFKIYVKHLWDKRTAASIGTGIDASRADLLHLSQLYWPDKEKVRAWLGQWDQWLSSSPVWFTHKWRKEVSMRAPPDVLPQTVLLSLLGMPSPSPIAEGAEVGDQMPAIAWEVLVQKEKARRAALKALQKAKRMAEIVMAAQYWTVAILLSYADLGGDLAIGLRLVAHEDPEVAKHGWVTFGLTGFSLLAQGLISAGLGQGTIAVCAALIGAKPLLDTYNLLAKNPLTQGTESQHARAFQATRAEEVVLQSLPQGLFQSLVLVQMEPEDRGWVQYASITGSLLAIAFLVSSTDRDMDHTKRNRQLFPKMHGYFPDDPLLKNLLSYATFIFISGYLASKWIALSALATVDSSILGVWLAAEFIVSFILRMLVEGDWRFHMRGLDAPIPSIFMAIIIYFGAMAAPFPFGRFPGWFGPSLYAGFVIFFLVDNFAMLHVACEIDSANRLMGQGGDLFKALVLSTAVGVFGMVMMFCFIRPSHRRTFYRHLPLRRMIDQLWETPESELPARKNGDNAQDDTRAAMLKLTKVYRPKEEKIQKWLEENWDKWERMGQDPREDVKEPSFWTPRFKNMLVKTLKEKNLPRAGIEYKKKMLAEKEEKKRRKEAKKRTNGKVGPNDDDVAMDLENDDGTVATVDSAEDSDAGFTESTELDEELRWSKFALVDENMDMDALATASMAIVQLKNPVTKARESDQPTSFRTGGERPLFGARASDVVVIPPSELTGDIQEFSVDHETSGGGTQNEPADYVDA